MQLASLLAVTLSLVAAPPAAAQSHETASAAGAASGAWNVSDPDFRTNGNYAVAVPLVRDRLTLTGDDVQGDEVMRAPGRFVGRIVCFRGRIKAVQDYPPIDGLTVGEVVTVTPDGTIVEFYLAGGSGDLQFDQPIRLCGYPVGRMTVPNRRGGTVEHLVVAGRQFDQPLMPR